jgi:hypothetical protein
MTSTTVFCIFERLLTFIAYTIVQNKLEVGGNADNSL